MSKRFILLLLATFFLSIPGFSQNRTVSGKVISADEGALPGVNVTIQGTTNGTVTDVEGNYTITVNSDNDVLSFTFVGYKTQLVNVGSQSTINVTLESDVTVLQDVVVIGYGTVKNPISPALYHPCADQTLPKYRRYRQSRPCKVK